MGLTSEPKQSSEAFFGPKPILTCKKQCCSAAAEPQVFKSTTFSVEFALASVSSSTAQPLFKMENKAQRSNAEDESCFFFPSTKSTPFHKPPLSSWILWCRHVGEKKFFSNVFPFPWEPFPSSFWEASSSLFGAQAGEGAGRNRGGRGGAGDVC